MRSRGLLESERGDGAGSRGQLKGYYKGLGTFTVGKLRENGGCK